MGTVILWAIGSISPAWPHGFAGNRIFPTTFEVDDPFVMDEFSMLASHLREAGTANVTGLLGTGLSADYTARIPDTHLGLVIGGEYRNVIPDGGDAMHGFGNLVVGTKYQFFTSNRHETIASIGLDAAIGNTGDQSLGAEGFSVILPYLAIGKGMGDLPKSLPWLKPFAITSQFGGAVPTDNRIAWSDVPPSDLTSRSATGIPTKLPWGFTIQYSLDYLQHHVRDVGLNHPFDQLIPVVEFAMESCLDGPCQGQTNGTVNPGLIWFGDYIQLGLAPQVPVNQRTASNVGVWRCSTCSSMTSLTRLTMIVITTTTTRMAMSTMITPITTP